MLIGARNTWSSVVEDIGVVVVGGVYVLAMGGEKIAVGGEVGLEGLDLEAGRFGKGLVLDNVGVGVVRCAVVDQEIVVFVVLNVMGDDDVVFEGGEGDVFLFIYISSI